MDERSDGNIWGRLTHTIGDEGPNTDTQNSGDNQGLGGPCLTGRGERLVVAGFVIALHRRSTVQK